MQEPRHPTSRRVARDFALRRGYVAPTAAIALCLLGLRVACGQDAAPSVIIDVGDCVSLKSPGERLDCYERHVEAAKHAAAAPVPAPQASAAPATSHTEAVSTAPGSAAATTSSAQASSAAPAAAAAAAAA